MEILNTIVFFGLMLGVIWAIEYYSMWLARKKREKK